MADPAVHIDHVTHRYDELVALRDVQIRIPEGVRYGLLGPNGGGKTTLFRILSTLLHPSEGHAYVFGANTVSDPDAVRRRVGLVFQKPALDEELTGRENLQLHGALYGLSGSHLAERIDRLAAQLGISGRLDDLVGTLSGGLQRRTDLARGLLHAPRLLLLDEPTTGLDPVARHAFWQTLDDLQAEGEMTLLVATHLMEEAERCDEVGIIDRGRMVVQGAPHDLKSEMGGQTLWLETEVPAQLAARIENQFGYAASVRGARVQVETEDAPTALTRLYEAFGDSVRSATVRTPTLEDVFIMYAGRSLDDENEDVQPGTLTPLS